MVMSADPNPYAQFVHDDPNPYAQMATIAQIQAALAKAQAAGNAQDVAALRGALGQSQQPGPSRAQLSQAFYAAKQAGNEDDARQIMGYVQQHGMTLAPMDSQQENAAFQKQNADNVSAMPWYEKAGLGAGHGFDQLLHGAEQIGDMAADKIEPRAGVSRLQALNAQIAANAPAADALMNSGWAQAGNVGAQIAASIPLGAGAGMAARGVGIGARALPFIEGAIANGGLAGLEPTQGSHALNALMGAGVGAAFPLGGKAVGAGARLVRNGLQYVVDPGAVADRAIAHAFGPDAQTALAGATPDAAGVTHTAAQVLTGPQAIAAEQAMRRAATGAQFVNRDVDADGQRLAYLQQFAGDKGTLAQRVFDRENAFTPYTSQLIGKSGNVQPVLDTIAQLRRTSAGRDLVAQRAMRSLERNLLKEADNDGNVPLGVVEGERANLGNTIQAAAHGAGLSGSRANVALNPVKAALVGTIRQQVPDVDAALQDYAERSGPINTQRMLQEFLAPVNLGINAAGRPSLTLAQARSLAQKLSDPSAGATPEASRAARDVYNSLLQDSVSKAKVGGNVESGAHGFRHGLLGVFRGGNPYSIAPGAMSVGAGGIAGGLLGYQFHHPILGAELGASLGMGGAGALDTLLRRRIVPLIGERAASAPAAAAAIQRATQPGLLSRMAPLSPVTPWLLPAAGATAMANQ